MKHGVANEFTFKNILPSFDYGVEFLPALVFNLMGFELVATLTREMKDVRDMPKAVFLSIGITAFEVATLLSQLYPGYQINGVSAREILLGGGNIHCITQQIPSCK